MATTGQDGGGTVYIRPVVTADGVAAGVAEDDGVELGRRERLIEALDTQFVGVEQFQSLALGSVCREETMLEQ